MCSEWNTQDFCAEVECDFDRIQNSVKKLLFEYLLNEIKFLTTSMQWDLVTEAQLY